MKITICGSMHFAKEMIETQNILQEMGHEAIIPRDTHECVDRPELNVDMEHCTKNDVDIDKEHFNSIAESDAIVVLNYPKNGIVGYVGGATLMEIGIARHLDKNIFLLNDIPSEKDLGYAFEIRLARPVILHGDLGKIPLDGC